MWKKIKAWFMSWFVPTREKLETKYDAFEDRVTVKYNEWDDKIDDRIDEITDKYKDKVRK